MSYIKQASYIHKRGRVYQYIRRIPCDIRAHYKTDQLYFSLRTGSFVSANRLSKSITQQLDDYWLGIRLQKIDIPKIMGKSTVERVFSSIRSIINLAIKEHGLEGTNGFLGTFIPDGLRETTRKPIPVNVIKDIQKTCEEIDDDLRWLIALLSDTGMRLGEAVGLLKSDIIIDTETPHLNLVPHPWRRLKTSGSERKIPLVGASLWSARRIRQSDPTNQFAFPRYCNEQLHNSNSASAALNKWLRTHAPDGCVVHSFRHSMRDRLRAVECPKEIIDQIGGWSSSDVGESYGKGFQLSNVKDWMNNLLLSTS